ncbi:MAG: 3-phosphoserine/phosphohydroxythreonine transaminase, partial [Planctomycetota bacterium]
KEAMKEGAVDVVYDAAGSNFDHVPGSEDYTLSDDAAYLYYCSNETIQGVQFPSEPKCPADVPLVCDASSDFLHKPLEIDRYGLIYACAQKNAGPAGVTVVVIRRDLLERCRDSLPGYLNYQNHASADSEWNTPPTFAIWVLGKVARWLKEDIGGLEAMEKLNREKSSLIYESIDGSSGFYRGHAKPDSRSLMNATFTLPSDELQAQFLAEAAEHQLVALKGHRSVGGIRVSVYNAMPMEGVKTLSEFMTTFAEKHG